MYKTLQIIAIFSLFFQSSIIFGMFRCVPRRLANKYFTEGILIAFHERVGKFQLPKEYLDALIKNLQNKPVNGETIRQVLQDTNYQYWQKTHKLAHQDGALVAAHHCAWIVSHQSKLKTLLKEVEEGECNKK